MPNEDSAETKQESKSKRKRRRDEPAVTTPPPSLPSDNDTEPESGSSEAAEFTDLVSPEPETDLTEPVVGSEPPPIVDDATNILEPGPNITLPDPSFPQEPGPALPLPAPPEATLPLPSGGDVPLASRWDEFLTALAKPTLIAVYEQGPMSFAELLKLSREDLLAPHGRLSANQVSEVEAWLSKNNLSLRRNKPPRQKPTTKVTAAGKTTKHFTQEEMQARLRKQQARANKKR